MTPDIIILYCLYVALALMQIRQSRLDLRMHEAHVKMICMLCDHQVDAKKSELLQEYLKNNKTKVKPIAFH